MLKGQGHFSIIGGRMRLSDEEFKRVTAMIGDGEYDMTVAKQAGIVAVGRITHGNQSALQSAGADFLVNDLEELAAMSWHFSVE